MCRYFPTAFSGDGNGLFRLVEEGKEIPRAGELAVKQVAANCWGGLIVAAQFLTV